MRSSQDDHASSFDDVRLATSFLQFSRSPSLKTPRDLNIPSHPFSASPAHPQFPPYLRSPPNLAATSLTSITLLLSLGLADLMGRTWISVSWADEGLVLFGSWKGLWRGKKGRRVPRPSLLERPFLR